MTQSVAIKIGGNEFACKPLGDADFNNHAAIYIILCVAPDGAWSVVDIGQAGQVHYPIDLPERRRSWRHFCDQAVWVGVHSMPPEEFDRQDRHRLEVSMRQHYRPPCGQM